MTNDPIADMLTRVRNAAGANHRSVTMPTSKMKVSMARVLQEEGFIEAFQASGEAGPHATLTLMLKPRGINGRALNGLRRISRPGLRIYAGANEIPRVLGGLGIAIVSTSRGLMTGEAARRSGVGGEVVAHIW
ncbi:MAG: 30S ribosomal protein S8 [Candidatus Dormibacteria bacterium]